MRTIYTPSRIVLARRLRRLTPTELALQLKVAAATLSHYERGRASKIGTDLLVQASTMLDFPPAFFTEREAVSEVDADTCWYRGRSRIPARDREFIESQAVMFHEFLDFIAYYLKLPQQQTALSEGSPEEVAAATRIAWGLADGPIPNLVNLLESRGVWVWPLTNDFTKNIDAFSYWHTGRAVIVLNPAKDDPHRARFDSAHELGHLLMHTTTRRGSAQAVRDVEAEANRFASAFLMPAETWKREAPRSLNPWHYMTAKERWGVSIAAMIRRNRDLGILSQAQYESAVVRYSKLGWRTNEPGDPSRAHEAPRLLRLCLESLGKNRITPSAIARGLELYPRNLELLGIPLNAPPSPPAESESGVIDLARWRAVRKATNPQKAE